MGISALRDFLYRYRIQHIFLWISVFIFLRAYYVLADPSPVVIGNAFMSTLVVAMAFYLTYLWLVPRWLNHRGLFAFFMLALLVMVLLSLVRTYLLYLQTSYNFPAGEYRNWRKTMNASLFHTGYAVITATILRLISDKYAVQRTLDILQHEKLSTELNYLKNQVNPHFLFNIHNSIYFLIHENPALAAEATLKLSHIMRYQIYDCAADTVTLDQELENLKDYIDLEKIRLGDSAKLTYKEEVMSRSRGIHPFILITLVENCFKHLGAADGQERLIRISLLQKDEWLWMETINSTGKKGPTLKTKSPALGLQNLQRRLELLYENNFSLETTEETGVYTAVLKIKLL